MYEVSLRSELNICGHAIPVTADYEEGKAFHFKGPTDIEVQTLFDEIPKIIGINGPDLPPILEGLKIHTLGFSVEPGQQAKTYAFTFDARFPVEGNQLDLSIDITRQTKTDSKTFDIDGHITFGPHRFDLIFAKEKHSGKSGIKSDTLLIANYRESDNAPPIKLKDLVTPISSDLAQDIPDSIALSLKDILLVYQKAQSTENKEKAQSAENKSKILFAAHIGTEIKLSNLPLVGSQLPRNQDIGITDLHILYASSQFSKEADIKVINDAIDTENKATQVNKNDSSTNSLITLPNQTFNPGLDFTAAIDLGSTSKDFALALGSSESKGNSSTSNTPKTPNTTKDSSISKPGETLKWFKIQKKLGPFYLNQIGFGYQRIANQKSQIEFLLGADLGIGPLSLALENLAVRTTFSPFQPSFSLDGLAIDFSTAAFELGGALLKTSVPADKANKIAAYDRYDGTLIIRTKLKGNGFSIQAIGSYAYYQNTPSLFIYAALNYPIGGPPFLFVTGLAAGFGYNRHLTVPTVKAIPKFPLIQAAIGTDTEADSKRSKAGQLMAEVKRLGPAIKPQLGAGFIAVGIKFTAFKLLDCFALLTAKWGGEFELDILGVAQLTVPSSLVKAANIAPLAQARLLIKACFNPGHGILSVEAILDSNTSYVLDKHCHITGGFALYVWFAGDHAGDFVITLGGYHPEFEKNLPSHYPRVQRLGLSWRLDEHLAIKGGSYFALCPHALMAGGALDAHYQKDGVNVHFRAYSNLLVAWQPFHYDILIGIQVIAKWWVISVNLAVQLHIWGPDFGGLATFQVGPVGVALEFGDQQSNLPLPISWTAFKKAFLHDGDPKSKSKSKPNPKSKASVCSITVAQGLIGEAPESQESDDTKKSGNTNKIQHLGVVNPKELAIATDSIIPVRQGTAGSQQLLKSPQTQFGVAPMALKPGEVITTQTI
ncbi:MAG: DUF6603 domain-containing protein, partial [Cyanobacteria bacterium P01_F01_bin.150]